MEMALTSEQEQFQESLNRFLRRQLPMSRLHGYARTGDTFDNALWKDLVELGVPGILVPEEQGGIGLGMLDAALAAEALGAAAAPVGFAATTVMASTAFLHCAGDHRRDEWLRRIARGEVRMAVAMASEVCGQTGASTLSLEGTRLFGRVGRVPDIAGATHVIVYLADGRAVVVGLQAEGVAVDIGQSVDPLRPLADLAFQGAEVEPLQSSTDGAEAALKVLNVGRIALAADTLGAAQAMLDKAVVYAKERRQFGRLVGSFQGVKYMCADMVTALEPCRALVWHAADLQTSSAAEADVVACQVKAHLGDVGRMVARMATEVHGGIGFTDELGLHYWLKRIGLNRQMLGGPEICREHAARLQGWLNH